jgi:hypothetical protein
MAEEQKKCTKCGLNKSLDEFYKNIQYKGGIVSACKGCYAIGRKSWYLRNRLRAVECAKQWSIQHKDKRREITRKWKADHPERTKELNKKSYAKNIEKERIRSREKQKKNPEKERERQRRWKAANPDKQKAIQDRANARTRSTPKGRLNDAVSTGVGLSLRGVASHKNGYKWETLVGYTVGQLMKHLEKQFRSGISWENYGKEWHVDHIIPIVAFNFETPFDLDFRRCWALKNWSKNGKIDKPFQPSLLLQEVVNG